jgi:hypothetical protein
MLLALHMRAALLAVAAVTAARSGVTAEPAPTTEDCIAASESGQDLRHAAKLSHARARFAVCVLESCPQPIRDDCAQRLDEIATAMPSVVFEITNSAGNDVPGVVVTMDGKPAPGATGHGGGIALELDPGEHTFRFAAAGVKEIEKRLVLVEGVKNRREVIILDRAGAPPIVSPTPLPRAEAPARTTSPPILAWVAFGVGGAGLGLGVSAGLVAGGKHSALADECDNNTNTCTPQYTDDLDAFHTWRTVSTIGYVAGALGVVGGAVLWFTAPKADAAAMGVRIGPASASVAGRF